MKAVVQNAYGSAEVLQVKEIPLPKVRPHEVLVRVRAASANAGDVFSMRGTPWLARLAVGFPKPKDYVLGWDAAGVVEAIGDQVTRFKAGDEVYFAGKGAFAEFACAPESAMAEKPASLSFQEAAAVPTAGLTAWTGLAVVGKVLPGQHVLINGAAGGVGSFAVQIAAALGAEVTGVCSTRNVSLVKQLGAHHAIDYTQQDFTRMDQRYDLILDNVANHPFSDLRRVLTPKGRILPNSGFGGMAYVFRAFALSPFYSQHAPMFVAKPDGAALQQLAALIQAGKLKPAIDRTYPLHEAAAALTYLEQRHAQGKVVLTVHLDSEV